jgi:uncharacterized membrane protein
MKVGDLVRIKKPSTPNKKYLDKLGVVMISGTWSADVYIIGSNSSWWPRFAKEKLEVICEGR